MKLTNSKANALIAAAVLSAPAHSAFNDAGTEYSAQLQNTEEYLDVGPASDALETVDMLMCILEATGIDRMPNQTYSALIDQNICAPTGDSTPSYITATLTTNVNASGQYEVEAYFDVGGGFEVVGDILVSAAPDESNPNGALSFNYKAGTGSNLQQGYLSLAADGSVTVINATSGAIDNWMKGTVDLAADSGNLTVAQTTPSSTTRYAFSEDFVMTDISGSVCLDRDEASRTTVVHEYRLFDDDGDAVVLTGPFGFTYGTNDAHGYAGPWGVWLENGETGSARPLTVTDHDGNSVSLCYDDDDTGANSCTAANDGKRLSITSGDDFASPIVFTNSTVGSVSVASGELAYNGGTSFNMPYQCSNDQGATQEADLSTCATDGSAIYSPKIATLTGTVLTDGTNDYHAAPVFETSTMASVAASSCSNDGLSLAAAHATPTMSDFPAISQSWADKPTVTAANTLKVIHGEIQ